MALLVRFVRARTSWPPEGGDRLRSLADFGLRPDEVGLSVWRVSSPEERDLVLAERACERGRIDVMDFIEVEEDFVRAFGEVTEAPTAARIRRVSALHCELDWDQETLFRLAEALLDAGVSAQRATKAELKTILRGLADAEVDEEFLLELQKLRT